MARDYTKYTVEGVGCNPSNQSGLFSIKLQYIVFINFNLLNLINMEEKTSAIKFIKEDMNI